MDLANLAQGEWLEKELTTFIEKRHNQRVKTSEDIGHSSSASEEMYEESVRRYHEQRNMQARAEWHQHHVAQASRLRATLEQLISHHEEQAEKCLQAKLEGA